MIEDDRVESMNEPKKEEDKKEDIEDKENQGSSEEITPKKEENPEPNPKKKAVKKKAQKPKKTVSGDAETVSGSKTGEKKKKAEEKEAGKEEKKPEEEKKEDKETADDEKKDKKKKGKSKKVVTTIISLVVIIAVILMIANFTKDKFMPKQDDIVDGDVAAVVNGEAITNEELEKQYGTLPAQYQMIFTKEAFLEQMINEKLLLQEATERGMEASDEEIEEEIKKIKMQFPNDEEFEKALSERGTTLDELKDVLANGITVNKLIEEDIDSKIEVSEDEARSFYDSNIEQFKAQEGQIRARHILIETEEDAAAVIERLDAGEDFAEVAKEVSTGPSGPSGGELGLFGKGQMVQEFEDVAFNLEVDEISEPVKTQFGYHIIQRESTEIGFEDVKNSIIDTLKGEQRGKALETYVKQLRAGSEIVIGSGESEPAPESISTFKLTGDDICSEDGKPIVRLFSTTSCPHCVWVKDAFDGVVGEYGDRIIAHHWELDKGEDTLTEEIETGIPRSELDVYKKYNSRGTVPTFVFGCKYYRIGNGYEADDDLEAEKAEFRLVIEELLSGTES